MRSILSKVLCGLMVCGASGCFATEQIVLRAAQDSFMRSNKRNNNSGANPFLVVAHSDQIRSLIAFDLSSVTNRILSAQLRIRQHNTMEEPLTLVVAPMADQRKWVEGDGALGVNGQLAAPGVSCWGFFAFPEGKWKSAAGAELVDLKQPELWKAPVARLSGVAWSEGRWLEVPLNSVSDLEAARSSAFPVVTYGLWGVGGSGQYLISAKESSFAPELKLMVEKEKNQ